MTLAAQVNQIIDLVPPGSVMTYGDLAELLGTGPRRIGAVMASQADTGVPWWRVVAANGSLPAGLVDTAAAHWIAEGTPLRADGTRVRLPAARTDLAALADAAEALLGPLPGASGAASR